MTKKIETKQTLLEPRLSRRQVAAIAGVSTETVKRAQHRGELPAEIMNCRRTRYRVSDVEQWLAQSYTNHKN